MMFIIVVYYIILSCQGDYGAVSCFGKGQRRYPHETDEKLQRHTFLVVLCVAGSDACGFFHDLHLSK